MKSKMERQTMFLGTYLLSAFLCLFLMTGTTYAEHSEHSVYSTGYTKQQPITAKNLIAPKAVALDSHRNLYVVESSTNRLHVFNAEGGYVRSYANLNKPISIAVDDHDRIYIGNAGKGNVEVYDSNLKLLRKLGSGDGEFGVPGAITTESNGTVFVADSRNDRVMAYDSGGSLKYTFGSSGSQKGHFDFPTSLAVDDAANELYVCDLPIVQTEDGPMENARIQVFSFSGKYIRSFGSYGDEDGMLIRPTGVVVANGRVYVTDSFENVIQIFDKDGVFRAMLNESDSPLRNPVGIAFDGRDRIYVASLHTGKIEVYRIADFGGIQVKSRH